MRNSKLSLIKIFIGMVAITTAILFTDAMLAEANYTVVRIDPAEATLAIGEVITINIRVDNVTGLVGSEIYMSYDPAILEVQDADPEQSGIQIAPGSLLKPDFMAQNIADPAYGKINLSILQLPPNLPVSGSGVLATITFKAIASGTSPLIFDFVNLSDESIRAITASLQHGQLIVSNSITSTPTMTSTYSTPISPLPQVDILGYHTVRYGETLFCIGRAYRVSPWAIASQNGISYPYTLRVGQRLAIPDIPWTTTSSGPTCQPQFGESSPSPQPTPAPQSWPTPSPLPRALPPLRPQPLPPQPRPVPPNFLPPSFTSPLAPPPSEPPLPPASSLSRFSTRYAVHARDTLASIAWRYQTTPWNIALNNGLSNPRLIFPGQVLRIR